MFLRFCIEKEQTFGEAKTVAWAPNIGLRHLQAISSPPIRLIPFSRVTQQPQPKLFSVFPQTSFHKSKRHHQPILSFFSPPYRMIDPPTERANRDRRKAQEMGRKEKGERGEGEKGENRSRRLLRRRSSDRRFWC